jgi:opacity protein-like surface antigen
MKITKTGILKSIFTTIISRAFIITPVLYFLFFSPLSAQRFQGGVFAGLTASQVDGDSHAGFDKLGLQGGVFVNTRFNHNFGARLEIRYAGKGARKPTSSDDTEVYKLALHYIDLPLMATYTFKKKVIFDLGIVPGYLFAKNGEDNGGRLPDEFLIEFKKIDIAWMVGVNYKITKNIIVNVRYSYSLLPINDNVHAISNYGPIGNLFGYNTGDYNNYLTFGLYYQIY